MPVDSKAKAAEPRRGDFMKFMVHYSISQDQFLPLLKRGVLDQFFPLGMPLRRVIKRGSLIIDASGIIREFGRQGPGPQSTIRLHKRSLAWTLLRNTELRFGEAYMDGAITIEKGTLRDLLEIVALN